MKKKRKQNERKKHLQGIALEENVIDFWVKEFLSETYWKKTEAGIKIELKKFLIALVEGLGFDVIKPRKI